MTPITNKAVTQTVANSLERETGGASTVQKSEPSKFDKVRADQLDKSAAAVPPELPPPVTEISPAQKQAFETRLSRRGAGEQPAKTFKADMQNTKVMLNRLGKRVAELPKTPAYDPIRSRFTNIEQQYNSSSQLLANLGKSNNPQDYLQVQMQMYMMTENIQLVSKVVDEVTSGAKTLLQTQI